LRQYFKRQLETNFVTNNRVSDLKAIFSVFFFFRQGNTKETAAIICINKKTNLKIAESK